MKTQLVFLVWVVSLLFGHVANAQKKVVVEARTTDLSYSLDLEAIASVFAEAKSLEKFERELNDDDNELSNLDLNGDGLVDYLRVVETSEGATHLVVIQAVLDIDVFQDVATIVVERDHYNRVYTQIIGDPYIYGSNYIFEPVYVHTPYIVRWFWTPAYRPWISPYYWGYYPGYYRYRHYVDVDVYLVRVHRHVNPHYHYVYVDECRSNQAVRLHESVRRNDYETRYPENHFSRRNESYRNKTEMTRSSSSSTTRSEELRTRDEHTDNGLHKGYENGRGNNPQRENPSVTKKETPAPEKSPSPSNGRSGTGNYQRSSTPSTQSSPTTTQPRESRSSTVRSTPPSGSRSSENNSGGSRSTGSSRSTESRTPQRSGSGR